MATDPETGEKGPRTVEALIRNTGPHLMVAVGTNKAGVENTTSDTIDATDNHPFWVKSRGEWVDAIELQPGDILLDEQGNDILVTELVVTEQDLTAYNLTIEDIHTYYAGDQPTLVHNCPGGFPWEETERAPLKIMHSEEAMKSSNWEGIRSMTTRDIKQSLLPGAREPLRVRDNGSIADGNTRISVLQERGVDVNSLPRVHHPSWDPDAEMMRGR